MLASSEEEALVKYAFIVLFKIGLARRKEEDRADIRNERNVEGAHYHQTVSKLGHE